MYRITYPLLFCLSYFGVRFFGLESTIQAFQNSGSVLQEFGMGRAIPLDQLRRQMEGAYRFLPFSIRCLDQAVVTWFLLNLHKFPAEMKIGLTLNPVMSHAWVELGEKRFIDFEYISDLQLVALYSPWKSTQL